MKAWVYRMLVIYMVLREKHCIMPWKGNIKMLQEEWVFSQTEERAFVNYLMVVNEWGFPMDEWMCNIWQNLPWQTGSLCSTVQRKFSWKEWFKSFMQWQRNVVNKHKTCVKTWKSQWLKWVLRKLKSILKT